MASPNTRIPEKDTAALDLERPYDLKFVPTNVDDEPGGGWYRQLPDGQIEVMTRAQLECVPLEHEDPEAKARAVVEKLIRQQNS
jgi:hypothetical protein